VICPFCGEDHDKVIDSRAADGGVAIRRRRQCLTCERRYTTYERVEKTARLVVVKSDGRREAFDSEKVLAGVINACGKRPIPEETKVQLVREVEDEVHKEFEREVPSREVGLRVARRLRAIDQIAYIRYASEYHNFKTLEDFAQELNELQSRPRPLPNERDLFPGGI